MELWRRKWKKRRVSWGKEAWKWQWGKSGIVEKKVEEETDELKERSGRMVVGQGWNCGEEGGREMDELEERSGRMVVGQGWNCGEESGRRDR